MRGKEECFVVFGRILKNTSWNVLRVSELLTLKMKWGDIKAMSCRWSASSDYRRMFVCFFKNGRILLRMCREKIRILDGGGDLIFCALFLVGGCKAGAEKEGWLPVETNKEHAIT